jgi:hypothetical protein
MLTVLADIADLLAAAGVIASLLFLAVQLRDQNRETRLKNWRELQVSLTQFKAVTNDLAMAELVARGQADYGSLGPGEKLAFGLYLEQGIHIIGNFDKHSGTVPKQFRDLDVAIHNTMLDLLTSPGARAWWAESKPRGRFLPSTAALIEKLQRPDARPIGPHL